MSEERRIADRVETQSAYIKIRDRVSETDMGTVANLSETGFMLVSNRNIDVDSVFQLEMSCCEDKFQNIRFGAVCLWNADTSSENLFWAGFHIIDISADAEATLQQIIAFLSQK